MNRGQPDRAKVEKVFNDTIAWDLKCIASFACNKVVGKNIIHSGDDRKNYKRR
jgi:hypothetical protein